MAVTWPETLGVTSTTRETITKLSEGVRYVEHRHEDGEDEDANEHRDGAGEPSPFDELEFREH